MQAKTTRAFRTISEAGEELDLQPHVLRFWESKFSQIKPIKRGGGRRFYRPEDIEFLRGIKILLHDEGHPIKDVQKLIRLKGPARVVELGQSIEKAATEKTVKETVLVPKRIQKVAKSKPSIVTPVAPSTPNIITPEPVPIVTVVEPVQLPQTEPAPEPVLVLRTEAETQDVAEAGPSAKVLQQREDLEEALERLQSLKSRWANFKTQKT